MFAGVVGRGVAEKTGQQGGVHPGEDEEALAAITGTHRDVGVNELAHQLLVHVGA